MKNKIQNKNRVNYEQVDSIISSDIVIDGNITSGGSARFEGNIKGNITLSGNLIIGKNAIVSGVAKATNVHVIGTVDGDVICDQLKILSTGKVLGDAMVKSIIIEKGAIFVGKCKTKDTREQTSDIDTLLDSFRINSTEGEIND